MRSAQLEGEEELGDDTGQEADPGAVDPSEPEGADPMGLEGDAMVEDEMASGDPVADDAGTDDTAAAEPEDEPTPASLKIGGALRYTYSIKSWTGEEANRDRLGDLTFDTFRVNADGTYGALSISAEYRMYLGYHMLHHGYVGYKVSDDTTVDVGVSQVPFGLLKYASHNWFFDLSYYIGMEDDYDMGVRTHTTLGDIDLWVAFFKNSEGSYTGASKDSARYSYDVVSAAAGEVPGVLADRTTTETNQGNVRAAYTLTQGDITAELGVSARVGGLYNGDTAETGYHWAAAAHANADYGPVNVQLQGVAYQFKPKLPAGQDDTFVIMGAYDYPYKVASQGYLALANVAYTLPIKDIGPISSIMVYNDFSILLKAEDAFETSMQNVVGSMIAAGPIYTYVDLAMGKNQAWLGPFGNYYDAFAAGDAAAEWHARFNINVGYYF